MNMETSMLTDIVAGRDVQFKREPGKGRPGHGKAISVGDDSVTLMLNDGRLDQIQKAMVTKVIKRRGKPAVSELERYAAMGFEKELQAA